jgi:hypothetical protein
MSADNLSIFSLSNDKEIKVESFWQGSDIQGSMRSTAYRIVNGLYCPSDSDVNSALRDHESKLYEKTQVHFSLSIGARKWQDSSKDHMQKVNLDVTVLVGPA